MLASTPADHSTLPTGGLTCLSGTPHSQDQLTCWRALQKQTLQLRHIQRRVQLCQGSRLLQIRLTEPSHAVIHLITFTIADVLHHLLQPLLAYIWQLCAGNQLLDSVCGWPAAAGGVAWLVSPCTALEQAVLGCAKRTVQSAALQVLVTVQSRAGNRH